ncbi:hypothetical protein DAPPUDRAFT_252565 [Daphnia pulex]|uniref:Uncharacterized protein n=1 Tax=Daphnia pulex TaxID=6669 RepID=E9H2Z9_DAPPU|nr:hypothetical protein DAPPUDRAFT_252565 [Daphnia pulex]|eukprot:EFX73923.1 hypothetical protein DAPPUDRAFT_252565 [Daphnia pulex]
MSTGGLYTEFNNRKNMSDSEKQDNTCSIDVEDICQDPNQELLNPTIVVVSSTPLAQQGQQKQQQQQQQQHQQQPMLLGLDGTPC